MYIRHGWFSASSLYSSLYLRFYQFHQIDMAYMCKLYKGMCGLLHYISTYSAPHTYSMLAGSRMTS